MEKLALVKNKQNRVPIMLIIALIVVWKKDTPMTELFVEQYPQHDLEVDDSLIGPKVQKENNGVSKIAGYLQTNFPVFFHPCALIKTNKI